jgi:hypothetical protein
LSRLKWYALLVPHRLRRFVRPIVFVLIVAALYGAVRLKRAELVDFVVPHTAAGRFIAHEPLYRPEDGHYQYKYFPAFALLMVPFTWLPKEVAQIAWFTLLVAMTWAFASLAVRTLPDRRLSIRALFWIALFFNGKFLVKELAFGQFNLPVALLILGAVIASQHKRPLLAGAAIAGGVFVKPYALIMVPWLALTQGWRPMVPFSVVLAMGLLLPTISYGWDGNLALMFEWYRTVSETTGPNLLGHENMSCASMWTKWIGAGRTTAALALVSTIVMVGGGLLLLSRRRHLREPNYLEGAYFSLLIPLISPQGWDYVLIIGLPAYVVLVDRWRELSISWRALTALGIFLTSFTIFDLLRRTLYIFLMEWSGVSVGAVLIAACLIHLRWRALA